ncbi:MAG: NAD(+) diphosphatase [Rhodomicrobium sp.]
MPKLIRLPKLAAQTTLNRFGGARGDAAYIAARQWAASTKVMALIDLKVPIIPSGDGSTAQIRWQSLPMAQALAEPAEFVFLGEEASGAAVFAFNIQPYQIAPASTTLEALKPLVDLRSLAVQGVLSDDDLMIAAQARALLGWHALNRCCVRCGSGVHATDGGWRRSCPACGLDAYPRTDPAVIMLITHNGRCLLGHEHRFQEKMYSTLAGFVEAGDDIENAVRREIKEEAGLDVGEVRYVASQPWPFPHSLMIGCWGEALTDAIGLDKTEIADARWFTHEEAAAMLARAHPDGLFVPPPISMAHTLIRGFVDGAFAEC